MVISIKRGNNLAKEGKFKAVIDELFLEERVKTKKGIRDVITVFYRTCDDEVASGRYFFTMTKRTDLGKLVMAANGGKIPAEIVDLEHFFMGKEVVVKIKHNKSEKTGDVFANVVKVFPLEEEHEEETEEHDEDSEYDEDSDDDDDEDEDEDEDDDEDEDEDEDEDDDDDDDDYDPSEYDSFEK